MTDTINVPRHIIETAVYLLELTDVEGPALRKLRYLLDHQDGLSAAIDAAMGQGGSDGEYVLATDYAALEAENAKLRAAAPSAHSVTATAQGDGWIPVSERLPEYGQEVIVNADFDGVCAGVLDSYDEWFAPCSEYKLTRITHWMPLPAAPAREEVK